MGEKILLEMRLVQLKGLHRSILRQIPSRRFAQVDIPTDFCLGGVALAPFSSDRTRVICTGRHYDRLRLRDLRRSKFRQTDSLSWRPPPWLACASCPPSPKRMVSETAWPPSLSLLGAIVFRGCDTDRARPRGNLFGAKAAQKHISAKKSGRPEGRPLKPQTSAASCGASCEPTGPTSTAGITWLKQCDVLACVTPTKRRGSCAVASVLPNVDFKLTLRCLYRLRWPLL